MRVVIINDVSHARGGATALALLEARLLRARGVTVTFAAGDAADNPMLAQTGAQTLALGEHRLLDAGRGALLRGLYNRRTLQTFAPRFAAQDTPDTVYHVHGWSQILSPSLFAALAPYRGRVVISAHDFFLACPNGAYADFQTGAACARSPLGLSCLTTHCDKRSYGHKLWRVARQLCLKTNLRFDAVAPRVLMIHEAMREPLRRAGLPAGSLHTLPNPVEAWSATRIEAESNNQYLFVGRLDEEKGPDLAARAARRAGVGLTFIGDGPLMAKLSADYPEFLFAGRLSPPEVARRAAQARALVMPSRYPEPFGLVAVEAMWSGLPALVARDALLAGNIVRRDAGLVFDPRDEAAFAAALLAAADDARLRALSLNAFRSTRDLALTPAAWAERLLQIFAAALTSSRAPRLAPGGIEREDPHIFDGQH